MLSSLYIQNFALIESLNQTIKPGLTVVTGETGAGKSILLGALQLALGGRVDLKKLALDGKKCVVEAQFQLDPKKWKDRFSQEDWDFMEESTLRREISQNGKSRAFINDSPVKLEDLKRLSEELINIHSQRDTTFFKDPKFIADFFDSYGGLEASRDSFNSALKEFKKSNSDLIELKEKLGNNFDASYTSYVLDEVHSANFYLNEEEELREELNVLSGSEDINVMINEIRQKTDNNPGLNDDLSQWVTMFERLKQRSKFFNSLREESGAVQDLFQSVMQELESLSERIESNPERLSTVEARLSLIEELLRKHRAGSLGELLKMRDQWTEKLELYELQSSLKIKLSERIDSMKTKLIQAGSELHLKRSDLFSEIERKVKEALGDLNMEKTLFSIISEPLDDPAIYGTFKYSLLFSANADQQMQHVEKVASGGERNRLMLALKSLFVRGKGLETILFDEIDSGVSGSTAAKVAEMFTSMGKYSQVIAITHLPQVAAAGSNHWKVDKYLDRGNSRTGLISLEGESRVEEVARLLAGKSMSEAALAQARFLLKN
jgi:DNA repair protein RecN (Recombination protein N)